MTKLNSKSWKEKMPQDIERKESFTSFRTFQIENNIMKRKNTLIPNAKPSLGKNTQSGVEYVLTLWILETESK